MLHYKKIEWWIQLVAIVLGFTVPFAGGADVLFACYFIVGGLQVLSCLVHFLLSDQYIPSRKRRQYLITVLVFLVVGGVVFLLPSTVTLVYLFILLFVSPCLAIWYLTICKTEIATLEHRSLVHLK